MEFKIKKNKHVNESSYNKSESPFIYQTDNSFSITNDESINRTARLLDFDQTFERTSVPVQKIQKEKEIMEFSRMKVSKSPNQEILEKYKNNIIKNGSPLINNQIKKSELKPKIYNAIKKKTNEGFYTRGEQLNYSQNEFSISPDNSFKVEEEKKYSSQHPSNREKSFNSKYLTKTYQILEKPLTSSDNSTFSYFVKKKLSHTQISSGLSKNSTLKMTKMNKSSNNFYDKGFLKTVKPSKSSQFSTNKKISTRNLIGQYKNKNLFSKAKMSKYKNISFTNQKKNDDSYQLKKSNNQKLINTREDRSELSKTTDFTDKINNSSKFNISKLNKK